MADDGGLATAAGPSSAAVSGNGGGAGTASGPASPATPQSTAEDSGAPLALFAHHRGGGSPLTPREAAEMDAALEALAAAATAARAGLAAPGGGGSSPSAAGSSSSTAPENSAEGGGGGGDAASLRTLVGHLVTAVGALATRTAALEEETSGPAGAATSPASSTTDGPRSDAPHDAIAQTPVARAMQASLARRQRDAAVAATIVSISGARGPYAADINGIYDPQLAGNAAFFFGAQAVPVVYKKRGEHFDDDGLFGYGGGDEHEDDEDDDPHQAWLYLAGDNTWWVSGPEPMAEAAAAGWLCTTHPVDDPTLPPFQAAPDPAMWSVYLGDGDFEQQPTLRVEGITADEAARRHHVVVLGRRVAALEARAGGNKGCCTVM